MLRAMKAPSRLLSCTLLSLVLAAFTVAGCSKKEEAADAAAEAAASLVVADAAPEAAAVVDAAVEAAAPLATTVAPRPVTKPTPVDPPICAAARSARKRNSPAAAGLEAQCRTAGGTP